MNTLNKINTVDDLVILMDANNVFFDFYKKYQKQAFLQLIRKSTFKESFYKEFLLYIKENDHENLMSLLKLYPIGKLFSDDELNKLQIELYKLIDKIDNLKNIKELLILYFYPSNKNDKYNNIKFIDDKFKKILNYKYIQSGSGIGTILKDSIIKAYNSDSGKKLKEQLIKEGNVVASNAIKKASDKINNKLEK